VIGSHSSYGLKGPFLAFGVEVDCGISLTEAHRQQAQAGQCLDHPIEKGTSPVAATVDS